MKYVIILTMKDANKKQEFVELRAKGMSFAKISEQIGVSKPTLIGWSRELELEVSNLKAIEMEALYEEHRLNKEARIKRLSNQLNRLETEIESRNLADVPTSKLFDLYSNVSKTIREETGTMIFKKESTGFELDLTTVSSWES